MATEAQIRANQLNALKSTGPRTDAGKATASRNATKLGLFSRHVLLPSEDVQEFEVFRDGLLASLEPGTPLERLYVDRMVAAGWRLQRTLAREAALFAKWRGEQPPVQQIDQIQKHIASLERSMDKALATLRQLQSAREARESREAQEKENLENEPNSEVTQSSARIEIVKTNPIALGLRKEERPDGAETPNREIEPNSAGVAGSVAVDPGGGAIPAPTPDVT